MAGDDAAVAEPTTRKPEAQEDEEEQPVSKSEVARRTTAAAAAAGGITVICVGVICSRRSTTSYLYTYIHHAQGRCTPQREDANTNPPRLNNKKNWKTKRLFFLLWCCRVVGVGTVNRNDESPSEISRGGWATCYSYDIYSYMCAAARCT